jgi:protein-disulfide isomerase
MPYIFILLFSLLLTSCSEKIDFSTPAQEHIDQYLSTLEMCKNNKKNIAAPIESAPIVKEVPKISGFDINEMDMVLGDENSKLILIEYFSPTCPHCAYFHKSIFPLIKKNYIDTGKIAYVTREFIGNKQDLDASILARCLKDKESFFKYTNVILMQQESWSLSSKYREILTNIGQLGGLDPAKYSECLNDNKLVEGLIMNTRFAAKSSKFVGTPAFFINGNQLEGAYSFEEISKAIDQKLKQLEAENNGK